MGYNRCALVFDARLSLRLTFRALQPNGLLLSMLSSDNNALQFLIIYLLDGHLVVSMASNTSSLRTRGLTSKERYDDAYWWQVSLQNQIK